MTPSSAQGGQRPIDDDMLHAYVDGRLDAAARERVSAWLEANPAEAARVADWLTLNAALGAAFEPVAQQAVPPRLTEAARARAAGPPPRWRQAAAAIVLLALGAGAGFAASELSRPQQSAEGSPSAGLADSAALAHRVFAVEVRHPVEVGADQEAHLVQWLSRRLGTRLVAPRLDDRGYRLVGGRLLAAGAGPAAQLMYEHADGRRITAFVASSVADRQTAFQFQRQGAVSTFYWVEGGVGYALSGEIDRAALLDLARVVHAQLLP